MCGIVGVCDLNRAQPVEESTLRRMLGTIRHRGPDQFGIYLDDHVGLGNARLSIIDLSTGQQPISNEDGSLWIVFNGEVFNHPELRLDLESRGHEFSTTCDTEVVLHAYEEYGADCLSRFNGQFAMAIWDSRERTCFMARDRLGVRPLFYTEADGALVFGSEIKAILAGPGVTASPDPVALDQIFTFWSTLSPRTFFQGIVELPPGHSMLVKDGRITLERYWEMAFPEDRAAPQRPTREYAEELRDLLIDAARIRLRADVPVGAYLSGGLDSSTITAIVRSQTTNPLETFSIAFADGDYDESGFQVTMAQALGTEHHVVHATHADIGEVFPEVTWHAETPLMRTAPAPMFLLSGLVRDNRFKVVLSGEGADELMAGYDLFREAKIRRFWAEQPDSTARPALLNRIYPWMPGSSSTSSRRSSAWGSQTPTPPTTRTISGGAPRPGPSGSSARRCWTGHSVSSDGHPTPSYPEGFDRWNHLSQAQYLETTILLSQYLLSSQGDRMAMGHSVEGRFPFLDHRVVEFANQLPPSLKLNGLTEKYLLKEISREWLPAEISDRPKQPYRAPIHRAFFNDTPPDYVEELLSSSAIERSGYFNPRAVDQLVAKLKRDQPLGETDDMALRGHRLDPAGGQAVHVRTQTIRALDDTDDVKVVVEKRSF